MEAEKLDYSVSDDERNMKNLSALTMLTCRWNGARRQHNVGRKQLDVGERSWAIKCCATSIEFMGLAVDTSSIYR
jgi:hypothetical protein